MIDELPLVFPCAGEQLLGVVSRPDRSLRVGVLFLVGGDQYRAGSHRHFTLLARALAQRGYASMRFDYRGMGDSSGAIRDFEDVSEDVGAALAVFQLACPTVQRIVLWGLCDAASAALLYLQKTRDPRIAGLSLLNPWVRSEQSLAQTQIRHYYGKRLMQRAFWVKLLRGKMDLLKSARGFLSAAQQARGGRVEIQNESQSFQDRMADGLRQFPGQVLLVLSGQDYTAREFLEFVASNPVWSGLMEARNVSRVDVEEADHTFSSSILRQSVEVATLGWLDSLQVADSLDRPQQG